jgi:hypothetical protein
VLAARWRGSIQQARGLDAEGIVALLANADAFRRGERFTHLLEASDCDSIAIGDADHYLDAERLIHALKACAGVDLGAVARAHPDNVADAVRRARVAAVHASLPGPG